MTHTHTHTHARMHTCAHTHTSLVLFVITEPFGDLRIFCVKLKGLFFCWTKPHLQTHTHTNRRGYTHSDTQIQSCLTWKLYTQTQPVTLTYMHSHHKNPQGQGSTVFEDKDFSSPSRRCACACTSLSGLLWKIYLRDLSAINICHELTHCSISLCANLLFYSWARA